jgi:hypothetical protein
MNPNRGAYDELYVYTMGRPRFILQHVVDAYAAQTATRDGKPITVVFALIGTYLHIEKQFSGKSSPARREPSLLTNGSRLCLSDCARNDCRRH